MAFWVHWLTRSARYLSNASFYLLLTEVTLAPLVFGSTKPVTVDFLLGLTGISLFLAPKNRISAKVFVVLIVAAITGVAYCTLCYVNSQPWWLVDPDILHLLPLLTEVPSPDEAQVRAAVLTKEALASGNALFFGSCLITAALHGSIKGRASEASDYATTAALIYIMFAILSYAIIPGYVLWEQKVAYADVLTATFINRNSAATFLGICTIIIFVSAAYKMRGLVIVSKNSGSLRFKTFSTRWRRATIEVLGAVLGLSAVFMTGSRAGVAATAIVIALISVVLLKSVFFDMPIPRRFLYGFFSLLAVLALFLSGRLLVRIEQEGLVASPRIEAYRAMIPIISAYSMHGTGAGSFGDVYAKYRPGLVAMNGVWDIAHSTPLEIMIEDGIPFFLLVLFAYLAVFFSLLRSSLASSLAATAALGAWAVIGLHSLVDFSFQIPGVSAVAAAMAGLSLGTTGEKTITKSILGK